MKLYSENLSALRSHATSIVVGAVVAVAVMARVEAQTVAVVVNGDPVTTFDIEQRTKLLQLGNQEKPPSRREVTELLIDEKLKIQLLKRYNIEGVDKDVENAYANMARRMRLTPSQLTEQLARGGVTPDTLKSRMKADIVWSQVIRGRYQSSFQFSDKDIQDRLQTRKPDDAATVGYDYTLRPILFIVTRGSPPASFEARRKEADELRGRFQNCEDGIKLARSLRFVAVRPTVVKGSAELPPVLRDILSKTEIGRLTAPEITQQGVETYALCAKRESDNAPAKKEVRDQLFNEQFESHSKRYLKELRGQAMIEYR
jgi:peptidyl-prolyl cis-trans isomerase SurA